MPESPILEVVEKPESPPSRYAVTGVYFFHADVFEICAGLRPSARGELEIADVLNAYARRGELEHEILEHDWRTPGPLTGCCARRSSSPGLRRGAGPDVGGAKGRDSNGRRQPRRVVERAPTGEKD